MCLAVPCGRKDSDGYLIDYVLFADWAWASDDDGSSFGKYRDGEYIDSALWKGCAYRPENAEQIAEWAAPLILRWASSLLTHGA